MLLGQLFYFEKEITKLGANSSVDDFLNIEIASIDKGDLSDLKGEGALIDFGFKLRELFIQNYLDLLMQNNLHSAVAFWKLLTSPQQINSNVKTNSDFQAQLLDWIINDGNIINLKSNVLNSGSRSSNQEDFALYYGLHVLYKIYLVGSNADSSEVLDLSTIAQNEVADSENSFDALPEILIIASSMVKPMIANLDCIFVDNSSTKDDIIESVSTSLAEFESIKMIIIDAQDNDLVHKIKRFSPKNVLITELNFSSTQENNFFDTLVKQTLGINLN